VISGNKRNTPSGFLASIYQDLIYQIGLNANRLSSVVETYLEKEARGSSLPRTKIASRKNNTIAELLSDKMSFKVFMKGLSIFNPKSIKLKVEITLNNGKIHSVEREIKGPIFDDEE